MPCIPHRKVVVVEQFQLCQSRATDQCEQLCGSISDGGVGHGLQQRCRARQAGDNGLLQCCVCGRQEIRGVPRQ